MRNGPYKHCSLLFVKVCVVSHTTAAAAAEDSKNRGLSVEVYMALSIQISYVL